MKVSDFNEKTDETEELSLLTSVFNKRLFSTKSPDMILYHSRRQLTVKGK